MLYVDFLVSRYSQKNCFNLWVYCFFVYGDLTDMSANCTGPVCRIDNGGSDDDDDAGDDDGERCCCNLIMVDVS